MGRNTSEVKEESFILPVLVLEKVPMGLGLGASFSTAGSSEVLDDCSAISCQVAISTPLGMGVSSHAMCLLSGLATRMTCFRELHCGRVESRSRAPASATSTLTSIWESSSFVSS